MPDFTRRYPYEGSWRPKGFDAVQEPLFPLAELAPRDARPPTLTVSYTAMEDGVHPALDLKVQRCPRCKLGSVKVERVTSHGTRLVEYVHAHQITGDPVRGARSSAISSHRM